MPTSAERSLYLDSSALVKLVVSEPESPALTAFVGESSLLSSCALAKVEVVRAVSPQGRDAVATAQELLQVLDLVLLDDELLDLAAGLEAQLRSLDAIHLAAALELGDALDQVVTYDERMVVGARRLGLPVTSPA